MIIYKVETFEEMWGNVEEVINYYSEEEKAFEACLNQIRKMEEENRPSCGWIEDTPSCPSGTSGYYFWPCEGMKFVSFIEEIEVK